MKKKIFGLSFFFVAIILGIAAYILKYEKDSKYFGYIVFLLIGGCKASEHNQNYEIYPTQNMWTFLKLDTRNGLINIVQYSVKGDEYRFETVLNPNVLVDVGNERQGRFILQSTQNLYNFILMDTINGNVWQVQWGTEPKSYGMWKISR